MGQPFSTTVSPTGLPDPLIGVKWLLAAIGAAVAFGATLATLIAAAIGG
jgi:hypothetical protein